MNQAMPVNAFRHLVDFLKRPFPPPESKPYWPYSLPEAGAAGHHGFEEHHGACEDAYAAHIGPLHLEVNRCFVGDPEVAHGDAYIGIRVPTLHRSNGADYITQYQWRIATTESFRQLAEDHCDCDLGGLFAEWVYER